MGLCLTGLSHFQIRFESFRRPFPSYFPALKLSPEWESQGVLTRPPAEDPWNLGYRTHILPREGVLRVRGSSRSIHCRLVFFSERKVNPVTSALRHCICHSPRVTVGKSRWTHHHEISSTVHFWHVSFCAKTTRTDPVLRKMWESLLDWQDEAHMYRAVFRITGIPWDGFSVCPCPTTLSLLSTLGCSLPC